MFFALILFYLPFLKQEGPKGLKECMSDSVTNYNYVEDTKNKCMD